MNYWIIIPHRNIPEMLQRCLDSIPSRSDVSHEILMYIAKMRPIDKSEYLRQAFRYLCKGSFKTFILVCLEKWGIIHRDIRLAEGDSMGN